MRLSQPYLAPIAHNQRPHKPSPIRSNVNAIDLPIMVNRYELLYPSSLPQQAHIPHKLRRLLMYAHWLAIQKDQYVLW